jgi:hypothetical protein
MKTDKSVPEAERHSREVRRLSTLLDVSQAMSGTLNIKSALHRVLEILARHHGAVRGGVRYRDARIAERRRVQL